MARDPGLRVAHVNEAGGNEVGRRNVGQAGRLPGAVARETTPNPPQGFREARRRVRRPSSACLANGMSQVCTTCRRCAGCQDKTVMPKLSETKKNDTPDEDAALSFLEGCGEAGRLVRDFDWSATSLGPIESWPAERKAVVSLILRSPVAIITLWGEAGVMIYNDGYSVVAGRRHPAIFGGEVRKGWPEVAEFNDRIMRSVLAGETIAYRDEELTLYRSGQPERVWLDLDYSPILDEAGAPVGVMAVVVETTSKVRAERRLRSERERLTHMFEQAPGLIVMLEGPEHVFTLANAAFVDFMGGREIIGRPLRDAVPEALEQGFLERLDEVRSTGLPFVGQGLPFVVAGTEHYLDFVFQPILSEDGAVTGIFAEGQIVTERIRGEAALRESEERFRLVAENAPVMLWMSTPDGSCSYLNAAQRRFWGVAAEDVAAFTWQTTIHPDDVPALAPPTERAQREHEELLLDVRLRRADGVYRQVRTMAHPRFGPDGMFLGMIGVNVDVTEARESEAALKHLNDTLEERVAEAVSERVRAEDALRQAQKMEAIGKLTGGVAHDFNNLLQVISGNLQLLARDVAGNARAEKRVATALTGVAQGARLASQLLAFSRRQPLEPKVINVGRLVAGMTRCCAGRSATGSRSRPWPRAASGTAWRTRRGWRTALLNLALNARDAMNGVGKLTIELGNAFLDDTYARVHNDVSPGQYVMLAVTDTGSGIAADIVDLVFEPFFTTKPQGKGTGLGLSMVYGFVKQSGGHVKIYSEPDHGTTVRIYLPRTDQDEDLVVSMEAGPVAGGTETILVAEDDDEVRATVVEMLTDLGYRVLTARDAQSALSVIESGVPIDLLFTDVVMPGKLRSPEMARIARDRQPGLAVLFTSGYTENSIVHEGRLDAGIELLSKPYTREALARKLRAVLGQGAEAAPPPRRELTVLFCEDEAIIRLDIAELLGEAGMRVIEAGTAAAALDALARAEPDVCVIDVGLPDMSGVELAVRIREVLPDVPVIFATGRSVPPETAEMALVETIDKPYGVAELRAGIERLVRASAQRG